MMMVHLVCLLFVTLAAATALPILPDSLSVNGISGNEQHTVFVLDPQYPLTLSWRFAAPAAYTAVAFKVNLIGGSPGAFSLGSDTWTSGAINATTTNIILPASLVKRMQPGERFEWSVSCFDGSSWSPSANASFNTAPDPSIWDKSSWIGGGSELRGELVLPSGTVTRAIAYTTGVGLFELHINGAKIGDHLLDAGEAVYDQKTLYLGFDVTGNVKAGASNAIGARLGNGKWGYLDIYVNRSKLGDQSG